MKLFFAIWLLFAGSLFGWLLRDYQQVSRIDTNIKQAILERNQAETRYYDVAMKREEMAMKPMSGYVDKKQKKGDSK